MKRCAALEGRSAEIPVLKLSVQRMSAPVDLDWRVQLRVVIDNSIVEHGSLDG